MIYHGRAFRGRPEEIVMLAFTDAELREIAEGLRGAAACGRRSDTPEAARLVILAEQFEHPEAINP